MEKTPKHKLKPNERRFAKGYVKNDFNGSKTAKEVYGIQNDGYARVKASELLTKPNLIEAVVAEAETLKSALEKQGVNPTKIALKIDELLNNKDPNAIDKGLKHAKDIYGVVEQGDKPKGNITYNFIQNTAIQADIKQIEEAIKAKLLNDA